MSETVTRDELILDEEEKAKASTRERALAHRLAPEAGQVSYLPLYFGARRRKLRLPSRYAIYVSFFVFLALVNGKHDLATAGSLSGTVLILSQSLLVYAGFAWYVIFDSRRYWPESTACQRFYFLLGFKDLRQRMKFQIPERRENASDSLPSGQIHS